MISSISGTVKSSSISSIVVEVGGVGILVQLPVRVAAQMQVGKLVNLHTYLIVREDALTLYGFADLVDRDFFELLLSVTGIGPKVADCVCLFGLDKTEAFPVDVHILRAMQNLFPEEKFKNEKEAKQFARKRWKENAGIAQQFIFEWAKDTLGKNKKKK